MYKIFFLFFIFSSCHRNESPLMPLGIKLKPLYQREMNLWIQQNSSDLTYKNPPENYPAHLLTPDGWLKGKLSLRGDLKKHWTEENKSYRFKFKNSSFQQMEEIDLVIPEDKDFEQEIFAYQIGQEFNLLVPKAQFVDLSINNHHPKSYLMIERFTEGSMELRNLPAGEIIKESNAWLDRLFLKEKSLYTEVIFSRKKFNVLAMEPNIYRASFNNSYTTAAFTHFSHMLSEMKSSLKSNKPLLWDKYIDMDQAAAWTALIAFFGGHHAALGDNLRWYFHPYRSQFRPIPYDILPEMLNPKKCVLVDFVIINPWLSLWRQDAVFMDKLKTNLNKLVRAGFLESQWEILKIKNKLETVPELKKNLTRNLDRLIHNRKIIDRALSGEGCLL